MDHISLARAKDYSDITFQTDTNCSSNKHRRANPRTFIKVGKDERKDSHKRPLRAGLMWLAQWEVVRLPCTPGVFSSQDLKSSAKALEICCHWVIHSLCWYINFPVVNSNEEIYMGQAAFLGRQTSHPSDNGQVGLLAAVTP